MIKKIIMFLFIAFLIGRIDIVNATNLSFEDVPGEAWVNVDRLNRRTCPSSSCDIVGTLMFRERVDMFEEKNGWVRISHGATPEWISLKFLSLVRPDDPAKKAPPSYGLVKGSDDFRLYKDVFLKAALKLISSNRCSAADFEEMGGWVKSYKFGSDPIYFTYCGGMTLSNKMHLNAETGEIF